MENIWKDRTILIAEDEDSNFKYMEIALRKSGVNILRAKNGNEAIQLVKDHTEIDLILMDIKMPEKNGLEATREIKQMKNDIPIIALTAYAMANDREMSLEAGCDDYISKPVRRNRIYSVLSNFLDG